MPPVVIRDRDYWVRVFDARVIRADGCWSWSGTVNRTGYGVYMHGNGSGGKQTKLAHRISWFLYHGYWPDKHQSICHRCDNPICSNPDHLFIGSQKDNMRDASEKRRIANQRKTHRPQGHEYSGENLKLRSGGRRMCVACNRQQQATWAKNYRAAKSAALRRMGVQR